MIRYWQVREFLNRRVEKFWMFVAWRMPKTLVMWCAVRVGAHATQGEYGDQVVPELKFMDGLKRWETA